MRHMDFPYHIAPDGRTSLADDDGYIRDLIEQVLFTAPGERVNRPAFGSGVLQLVFAPQDSTLAQTTQALVQGALQRWLGQLIEVEGVQVVSEDATLQVAVQYVVRRTQRREQAQFLKEV